jgi:hypothetical protein
MSKTFFNPNVSFSSIFFGGFSAMGVQKHLRKKITKNRVEKFLQELPIMLFGPP